MIHRFRRLHGLLFEETQDIIVAIDIEKEIRKWRREKKDQLVNRTNPIWKDLCLEW